MLREVLPRSHSQEIASTGPAKLFSPTLAWNKGHVPFLGQEGRWPGTGILVGFHRLQGGSWGNIKGAPESISCSLCLGKSPRWSRVDPGTLQEGSNSTALGS